MSDFRKYALDIFLEVRHFIESALNIKSYVSTVVHDFYSNLYLDILDSQFGSFAIMFIFSPLIG